ncbi:hypothetical protein MYX76_00605 [Desulfobacterota bacterium AH_259_B03_O07]|nr:hypothetical protein [Desulfobacterota bacterium AH_259_B03_O07]
MKSEFEEGSIVFNIDRPFTLRDLAGPWSWVANRYYWFVFDELFMDYYIETYKNGNNPTNIITYGLDKVAGQLEISLEKTSVAFLVTSASSGSILLKVSGVYKALKSLTAWLPLYGKWVQEKGEIDIATEVKRSEALNEITKNFVRAGIPEDVAFSMAYERLYRGWPDFYSPEGMGLAEHITSSEVENTGNVLTVKEREIHAISPREKGVNVFEKSDKK